MMLVYWRRSIKRVWEIHGFGWFPKDGQHVPETTNQLGEFERPHCNDAWYGDLSPYSLIIALFQVSDVLKFYPEPACDHT